MIFGEGLKVVEGDFPLNQVSLLDFPWVLDYILATRFNCSLRQIRHAVCSIVENLSDAKDAERWGGVQFLVFGGIC